MVLVSINLDERLGRNSKFSTVVWNSLIYAALCLSNFVQLDYDFENMVSRKVIDKFSYMSILYLVARIG